MPHRTGFGTGTRTRGLFGGRRCTKFKARVIRALAGFRMHPDMDADIHVPDPQLECYNCGLELQGV